MEGVVVWEIQGKSHLEFLVICAVGFTLHNPSCHLRSFVRYSLVGTSLPEVLPPCGYPCFSSTHQLNYGWLSPLSVPELSVHLYKSSDNIRQPLQRNPDSFEP